MASIITAAYLLPALSPAMAKKKKKAKSSSSCKKWRWNLGAKDSTGKTHWLTDYKEPVLMLVYAGKNTADTNVKAHDALKKDKELKKGGKYNKLFRAFGIANYQETWVPNWIISMIIARKIRKYKVIIWNDKDNCFSGKGKSSDCMGGKKRKLFRDGKQNSTFLYKRYFVRNFVGKVNSAKYLKFTKALTQAAQEGKDICWVKENIKY